MLPVAIFGIIVMVIGEYTMCTMCRDGKWGITNNKVLKKIVEHSNTSGKCHSVNYK